MVFDCFSDHNLQSQVSKSQLLLKSTHTLDCSLRPHPLQTRSAWHGPSSFLLAFWKWRQPTPLNCGCHSLQCQTSWLARCILPGLQHAPHYPGLSQLPQPQDCSAPLPWAQLQVSPRHLREKQHPGDSAEGTSLMTVSPAEARHLPQQSAPCTWALLSCLRRT